MRGPRLPGLPNPFAAAGRFVNYVIRDPKYDSKGNPVPYSGMGGGDFVRSTISGLNPITQAKDTWKYRPGVLGGEPYPGDPIMMMPFGGKIGPGLPKGPAGRAALEAQVKAGQALGGPVKVTKMSPAQMAKAKAERDSKAGINTADIIMQHGSDGLLIKGGQAGAENLLAIAKHPGHSNTTFFQAGGDVFGRPLTPAMERAIREGPEGTRAAYIVDQEGRITVGGPGTHHDQLMKHKGITDPKSVIQGEIHFEQDIGGGDRIPARVYTGRSMGPGIRTGMGRGLNERMGKMDETFAETFGPGKPNHLQTAAIEDWMNKANGIGGYVPMSGKAVTPASKINLGRNPAEAADAARARVLRRKLAGEPNPLGKASPSALQIAGRSNPNARNEASRLAGGPTRPDGYESKRVKLGVQPGGMGHGALARPEPKVITPSRTTSPDAPKFIPMGPRKPRFDPKRRGGV